MSKRYANQKNGRILLYFKGLGWSSRPYGGKKSHRAAIACQSGQRGGAAAAAA
jgi:hypothetical protein